MDIGCFLPHNISLYFIFPSSLTPGCLESLSYEQEWHPWNLWMYLIPLSLTILIELGLYWVFLRKIITFKKVLFLAFILNISTHPAVTFFFPYLGSGYGWSYAETLAVGEVFAFVVEGIMLKALISTKLLKALGVSFLVNILSWWMGSPLVDTILFFHFVKDL